MTQNAPSVLSVDVVVYHDNETRMSIGSSNVEKIMAGLGLQHTFSIQPEYLLQSGTLLDRSAIPQNAITLVHGNTEAGYPNVQEVRRLAQRRDDLQFIVSVDGDFVREGRFQTQEDYQCVREALSRECHPQYPIAVTPVNLLGFLVGKDITYEIEENFERYMQRWKELQEAERA